MKVRRFESNRKYDYPSTHYIVIHKKLQIRLLWKWWTLENYWIRFNTLRRDEFGIDNPDWPDNIGHLHQKKSKV